MLFSASQVKEASGHMLEVVERPPPSPSLRGYISAVSLKTFVKDWQALKYLNRDILGNATGKAF
ncbi:hypothetical protein [Pyrobaculum sp.]|uniref:hypothetical protein n=1 Tax=Pyrobaculum sp. TaxID=2004705 RepID=UPI00316E528F